MVVGRLVSTQPPWSMATSITAAPGFMVSTMARVTTCGVRLPATSTAPITTSAEATNAATDSLSARQVSTVGMRSISLRSFSASTSSTVTCAPAAQAARAARAGAQQVRGDGNGHLAGNLADRPQHRQAPVILLNHLQPDGCDGLFHQPVQHHAVGHGHVIEGHEDHAVRALPQLG